MNYRPATRALPLIAMLTIAGCATNPLSGIGRSALPHEPYHDTLRRAGLDQTALGPIWTHASEEALRAGAA